MPSRQSTTPSLPHLSTILNLHPEQEPCCAGIARTKGRRCQLRTNAFGRKTATRLLNRGTDALHAGRDGDLENILYSLAPHVLCTRWHQGQDSELVNKWKRLVERYWGSLPENNARSVRGRTMRSSETRPERHQHRQQERITLNDVERLLDTRLDEIRTSIETREARRSRGTESTRRGREVDADEVREGIVMDFPLSPRRTQIPTRQSAESVQSQANIRVGRRQNVSVQISVTVEIEPIIGASEAEYVDESDNEDSGDDDDEDDNNVLGGIDDTRASSHYPSTRATRRQAIEGECSICLDPLQRSRSSQTESVDQRNISWCRAQCGVNFHSRCINEWLSASSTCPHCRATWEH